MRFLTVCDTLTIMRDRRIVHQGDVSDIDRPTVVKLMVGDRLAKASESATTAQRRPGGNGVRKPGCRDSRQARVFRDISFDAYRRPRAFDRCAEHPTA
jgi:ABC-type sugar transport system ATPase subunit